MNDSALVQLTHVDQVFILPAGKSISVLSDINVNLRSGELIALLGPSGCGKSTLVRIIAGLLQPTKGEVTYHGKPVTEPNPEVALVFQQFALYPWLTVSQNIEQVLIPRGIDRKLRRQRVAEVISLIGLEGFEEAYPRELSGGMKQRVGIARALVVRPELLCMDEPFSQVDALTAETLRTEVVNLWHDRQKYPQSICMVSHDIHEVAFMASRILIMAANPGRIKTILENPLPYPRNTRSAEFQALVDRLHGIITGLYMPEEEVVPPPVLVPAGVAPVRPMIPLPLVEVRDVIGLLDLVNNRGGDVELFLLTTEMGQTFTRILLAIKAAELLGFLQTPQDHLVLTELGRQFLSVPADKQKEIFRHQLITLPFVKRIQDMLEHSEEHRLEKDVLLGELAIQFPREDIKRLFRIIINWGRFAEIWNFQKSYLSAIGNGKGSLQEAK